MDALTKIISEILNQGYSIDQIKGSLEKFEQQKVINNGGRRIKSTLQAVFGGIKKIGLAHMLVKAEKLAQKVAESQTKIISLEEAKKEFVGNKAAEKPFDTRIETEKTKVQDLQAQEAELRARLAEKLQPKIESPVSEAKVEESVSTVDAGRVEQKVPIQKEEVNESKPESTEIESKTEEKSLDDYIVDLKETLDGVLNDISRSFNEITSILSKQDEITKKVSGLQDISEKLDLKQKNIIERETNVGNIENTLNNREQELNEREAKLNEREIKLKEGETVLINEIMSFKHKIQDFAEKSQMQHTTGKEKMAEGRAKSLSIPE